MSALAVAHSVMKMTEVMAATAAVAIRAASVGPTMSLRDAHLRLAWMMVGTSEAHHVVTRGGQETIGAAETLYHATAGEAAEKSKRLHRAAVVCQMRLRSTVLALHRLRRMVHHQIGSVIADAVAVLPTMADVEVAVAKTTEAAHRGARTSAEVHREMKAMTGRGDTRIRPHSTRLRGGEAGGLRKVGSRLPSRDLGTDGGKGDRGI